MSSPLTVIITNKMPPAHPNSIALIIYLYIYHSNSTMSRIISILVIKIAPHIFLFIQAKRGDSFFSTVDV